MKTFLLFAVIIAAVSAEDDGQYRPYNQAAKPVNYQAQKFLPAAPFVPKYTGYKAPAFAAPAYKAPIAPAYKAAADGNAAVLRSESANGPDGSFHFDFETQNGIKAAEQATVQLVAPEIALQKRTGFYEYHGTDGALYRVDFIADENGYQPSGQHLPTPPPIPEAIARSLDFNLRNAH